VLDQFPDILTGKAADQAIMNHTSVVNPWHWLHFVEFDRSNLSDPNQNPGYVTTKQIKFECTFKGHLYEVCVPKNFSNDLASIPSWLWGIYKPWGTYTLAAIIHDYLTAGEWFEYWECDRIFLEAMAKIPPTTPWRTRNIFWMAVRLAGKPLVYSKHTKESVAEARKDSTGYAYKTRIGV
jgi:hypothetical protein